MLVTHEAPCSTGRGGFRLPLGRPASAETLRAGRPKSPLPILRNDLTNSEELDKLFLF
jgi:hypothetical protein